MNEEIFEKLLQAESDKFWKLELEVGNMTSTKSRWLEVSNLILRQLVLDPNPVEFVTELLLPFTFPEIKNSSEPWESACRMCNDDVGAPKYS